MTVLVKAAGQPVRPGVFLNGPNGMRNGEALVLCEVPEHLDSITVADDRGGLDGKPGGLDDTLLISASGKSVRAIRSGGKWIEISRVVEESSDKIDKVEIRLSGNKSDLRFSCRFDRIIPYEGPGFSIVAASTFELETQGSESIEERLASAEAVPLTTSGFDFSFSKNIAWNGLESKVWIRISSDNEPGKLLLDEEIDVKFTDGFTAKWAKVSSALVSIPDPDPDIPADLVSAAKRLDVRGAVLDLVAAGDGTVVMVRTDAEPFWVPLDLKTGIWQATAWEAKATTLLAAQAGKVYLFDRDSKVLEVWNSEAGTRESLQILQVNGPVLAFAAPLSNADKPLMVVTEEGGTCFDPVHFDPIRTRVDLSGFFSAEATKSHDGSVDPATASLRVSEDGALYSFSGTRIPGGVGRGRRSGLTAVMGQSSMVSATFEDSKFPALRGRVRSSDYPDHGGSAVSLVFKHTSSSFPGSMGAIRFTNEDTREVVAELKNLPAFPPAVGRGAGPLAADMGCYFDSKAGTLLIPDGKNLHYLRLDISVPEPTFPRFVLAGETLEIPLQAGTGHTITSSPEGETTIEGQVAKWTAPISDERKNIYLTVEWKGELGSILKEEFRVDYLPEITPGEVVSRDGGKRIPLKVRGVLDGLDDELTGLAGSGVVGISNRWGKFSVWNLASCEKLRGREGRFPKQYGISEKLPTTLVGQLVHPSGPGCRRMVKSRSRSTE